MCCFLITIIKVIQNVYIKSIFAPSISVKYKMFDKKQNTGESVMIFKRVVTISVVFIVIMTVFTGSIGGSDLHGYGSVGFDEDKVEDLAQSESSLSYDEDRGVFLDTVDPAEEVGKFSSIESKEIEGEKHVFVTYHDEVSESLKLAQKNLDDPEDDWDRWSLDDELGNGMYSSLEVTDGLMAHISYNDPESSELKYAIWCIETNTVKLTETIDDEGEVGEYVSLELGEDNHPMVSYYDRSERALKYAERLGYEGWDTYTVDSGNDVGRYTSLALDSSSNPHISYYDWDFRELKYAFLDRSEERWSKETIKIDGRHAGRFTSIELDDDDDAHISCYGWTDDEHELLYVTDSEGDIWTHEVVSQADKAGTYTSLELTEDERPLISYHEWGEENLRFAIRDLGEWEITELDTDTRVGSHTSLHYSGGSEVQISYYDEVENNLRHARYFFENRTPLQPTSFRTRSEYGDVILEWDTPIYDGIIGEKGIEGYNVYRSEGGEFQKIEENLTRKSYTDEIPEDKETETYRYRVAAINKMGVGDNTSEIRTKGRYFDYDRLGPWTNEYFVEGELFPEDVDRIKWDLDHDPEAGADWDRKRVPSRDDVRKEYDDPGLRNVLLKVETSEGEDRSSLQSVWVLGEFELTSSYEEAGSEEYFFHLPEDKSNWDNLDGSDSLKNTYILESPQGLPYEKIEFEFRDDREEIDEPRSLNAESLSWSHTFPVSDAPEDDEVKVQPLLYNKYRETVQSPLTLEKEVDMIETPPWFFHLMDFVLSDHLSIENEKDDGSYTGWEIEIEVPEGDLPDEMDMMNITSVLETDIIDDLNSFFGGDYGFDIEFFPDRDITISNDPEGMGFETTLIEFQTDVDEDDMGLGGFEGELGNTIDYAGDTEIDFSVGITVDIRIDREGISVDGTLELETGTEIGIDIPLKSIGIAEVGLTAEIEGGIGVEFEIGELSYDLSDGFVLEPGLGEEIPIELDLDFGGGPYGEAGAGFARLEGLLVLDMGVDVILPSMERTLDMAGKFEVTAEALWGLWEKTREWELYSTSQDTSLNFEDHIDEVETYSLERLAFEDHDVEKRSSSEAGEFGKEENVGPRADPEFASLNESYALGVWSELSDRDSTIISDLYMREFDDGNWSKKESFLEKEEKMRYEPQLITMADREKIALFYLETQDGLDENSSVESFYQNNSLRGKIWCPEEKDWDDLDLEHSIEGESITDFDVDVVDEERFYIVYRFGDPDIDPFSSDASDEKIGVLSYENGEWEEEILIDEDFPRTSSPSIKALQDEVFVTYTRNMDDEENRYDELCYNETILLEVDSEEEYTIRETKNTTSYQIISEEDGKIVVSWIENHTEIRRKSIGYSVEGLEIPDDFKTVRSGVTISSLSHHENASGHFYVFQKGPRAEPTVLEKLEDDWSRERDIATENKFSPDEISAELGLEVPTVIVVEEENTIGSWHRAHHNFGGSSNEGKVEDRSGEGNHGTLKGNWTEERHTIGERDGGFVRFEENGRMEVPHSPSLDITDPHEEFTVTSVFDIEEGEEGHLFRKDGSWSLAVREERFEIELWDVEGNKHVFDDDSIEIPSGWSFLALRYERGYLNVTSMGLSEEGSLEEHTTEIKISDFDLKSSSDPLILSGDSMEISVDDIRLVERYLPTRSLERIKNSRFPNFDSEFSVTTEKVPPYFNFTHTSPLVVGESMNFEGWSPQEGLNWTWSFGDKKRYGREVEHVFTETGLHDIELKIRDDHSGATSRKQKTIHVLDLNPPCFEGEIDHHIYEENNSVRLDWNEAVGTSEPFEYRVHHTIGEEEIDTDIWLKRTEKTTAFLEDLDPSAEHRVQISVRNSVGLSNQSSHILMFEIEDTLPPEFEGLENAYVSDHSEKTVMLSWEDAEDRSEPIRYNIYHSRREDEMCFEEPIERVNNETGSKIELSEKGEHFFAVRAEDSTGNEEENEVILSVEIEDVASPLVEITSPLENETVSSTAVLRWDVLKEDQEISRFLLRSDDQDSWTEVESETFEYTFEMLPEGERTLKLLAEDPYGNYAFDEVNITVVPALPEPQILSRSPSDGVEGMETEAKLEVQVGLPDEEEISLSFHDAGDDSVIEEVENVEDMESVSIKWSGLEHGTTYRWYVVLEQDVETWRSETWEFVTLERYSLEVDVVGNGSTDPSEGEHRFEESELVDIEAEPDEGWEFIGWSGDVNSEESHVELEMNEDRQVTAKFEELDEEIGYELNLSVVGEGDVGLKEGTHSFDEGEDISLKAEPDEGWQFERWSEDIESDQTWLNLTIEEDLNITAHFEEYDEDIDDEGSEEEGTSEGFLGIFTLLDKFLILVLSMLAVIVIIKYKSSE